MKLYKINQETLTYEEVNIGYKAIKAIIIIIFLIGSISLLPITEVKTVIEKVPVVLNTPIDSCNKENIKKEIKKLNLRFPEIVFQQIMMETGHLKDPLFLQTNNLFCMKKPSTRSSTLIGQLNGFAVYEDWKYSLIDYALWQEAFTRKVNSAEEYYQLLDKIFCEPDNSGVSYSRKLKQINN